MKYSCMIHELFPCDILGKLVKYFPSKLDATSESYTLCQLYYIMYLACAKSKVSWKITFSLQQG